MSEQKKYRLIESIDNAVNGNNKKYKLKNESDFCFGIGGHKKNYDSYHKDDMLKC